MMHRIVIVGGGFGGVTVTRALKKSGLRDVCITLISERPWLEYYGVLYRLIRGESPDEACMPLHVITGAGVHRVIDSVQQVDPVKKTVIGNKQSYAYDTLVLAPGSVPAYFGIAGMEEHAMTLRCAADALDIRERVIAQVAEMAKEKGAAKKRLGRFVVIGGGPTGIEVSGEILPLARLTARTYDIDTSAINVDLLEAADRLLPAVEESASRKVQERLAKLGVNVRLQCAVASADVSGITLASNERLDAATVIWTAGVKAHPLLGSIPDVELDKRGRAVVDGELRMAAHPDIFVVGDCASTPYSGMAQTAVEDGLFVARVIAATIRGKPMPVYKPKKPAYAIPAGTMWSAVKFGPLRVYGILGSVLRRAADIHVYMLILPWRYVPMAFFGKAMRMRHEA